jgi:glycosyltransferase involved in cell wall biosynthesis
MRIGFDAKRIFNNNSGLGNYSRFVLSALHRLFPQESYYLYTTTLKGAHTKFLAAAPRVNRRLPNKLYQFFPGWWRTRGLGADLLKENIQLYHGLSNELPLGLSPQIKAVVTIHDLIFKRYPALYKPLDRWVYDFKFKYACHRADVIIAISERTKQDIIQYYNITATKIKVIYQDCDPLFHRLLPAAELETTKQKYHLPDKYILCVGTLEPRKNQLYLLKAWVQAKLADIPIVFIGRATAYKQELLAFIQTHKVTNQVIFMPYIPTPDLPAIYQLAHLFVYPSVFEGFGIPILEAINSGIPVITSTGSCFAEAGGNAAQYADPDNITQLADLLVQITTQPTLRGQMIQAGFQQAQVFRAEKTIPVLHQLYQDLVAAE